MTLPTFFVVGAARSGTTSLYHLLRQHPEVFLPAVKEPHYFAYLADPVRTGPVFPDRAAATVAYRQLYACADGAKAIGDLSTSSLAVPGTAEQIAAAVPEARIIAVLRDPIERARSHHRFFLAAGAEDEPDLRVALRDEDERLAAGAPYTYAYGQWGEYHRLLLPYLERFGHDRVSIHLHEDLVEDELALAAKLHRFLGVDPDRAPRPLGATNGSDAASPRPRRRLLGRRGAPRAAAPQPPTRDRALRDDLLPRFRDEVLALQALIGRDLSGWLR